MDGGVLSARYRGSASLVTWKSRGPRTITFIQVSCASALTTLRCSALVLMGFFSSRRHDTDLISTSPRPQSQSSPPSPGIIRSRFVRMNASHVLLSYVLMLRCSSALPSLALSSSMAEVRTNRAKRIPLLPERWPLPRQPRKSNQTLMTRTAPPMRTTPRITVG
jgi:hypothetical protein